MKILVFLQNMWRRGAVEGQRGWLPLEYLERLGEEKYQRMSRISHEWALWKSPTGKGLEQMLPLERLEAAGIEVVVTNASPLVGSKASSRFPMDAEFVRAELMEHQPRLLVLLGEEAHKIVSLTELPVVLGPHPAFARRFKPALLKEVQVALLEKLKSLGKEL